MESYKTYLKESNISKAAYDRMYGLSKIKSQEDFQAAAKDIYDDLIDEGFEPFEVIEFLNKLVKKAI
jgi:hypothetical protein